MGEEKIRSDFHYYYRIANADGELFWRRIHADAQGEKVIKRKVSTGNHYYLFHWLWVCCVKRKVCRRRDFLLLDTKERGAKNDSRRRALVHINLENCSPYSLLLAVRYDLKIIAPMRWRPRAAINTRPTLNNRG